VPLAKIVQLCPATENLEIDENVVAVKLTVSDTVNAPVASGADPDHLEWDVSVQLDRYSVGYWDDEVAEWVAEEGEFEVRIGASSQDIRQKISFSVNESFTWIF